MSSAPVEPDSPRLLARVARFLERVPWLIPAVSFVSGAIGFAMVKRGADLARVIAMIAYLQSLGVPPAPPAKPDVPQDINASGIR